MLQPKHTASRRGFTLMELLVVVAIIAVLISFLLPALSQARRNANTVKCLSALRDLHNAFNMYAVDNNQAWPVVLHAAGTDKGLLPVHTTGSTNFGERHWTDLIAKYAGGQKVALIAPGDTTESAQGIYALKDRKSNIWGCPEWQAQNYWDPNATTPNPPYQYCTGYGMNFVANPDDYRASTNNPPPSVWGDATALISNHGWLTGNPAVYGRYQKTSTWGKKGADKVLLADSQTYYISAPQFSNWPSPNFIWNFQGYPGAPVCDPDLNNASTLLGPQGLKLITVDGGRHAKSGTAKDKLANSVSGVNVLFCDGHAATVNVHDVWRGILYPGTQK